jgi:hypothetical protein
MTQAVVRHDSRSCLRFETLLRHKKEGEIGKFKRDHVTVDLRIMQPENSPVEIKRLVKVGDGKAKYGYFYFHATSSMDHNQDNQAE